MHVISGLRTGGAERALARMVAHHHEVEHLVVSMRDEGTQGPVIRSAGVEVATLDIVTAAELPAAAARLAGLARRRRPALVQGWMYHGNLGATLAAKAAGGVPAIWGVRQGLYDLRREARSTALAIRLSSRLSSHPAAIVYNSASARVQHEAVGFSVERGVVIPNGFPETLFVPVTSEERGQLRRELRLPLDTLVIGAAARNHPIKGLDLLLAAAAELPREQGDLHVVLCGPGTETLLGDLPASLQSRVIALGERADAARLMRGFDLYCLPSRSEGFPNVVAEAMAAGVPVVAADVGDAAEIVGDTGWIVPREDAPALARALLQAAQAPDRAERGAAARRRIRDRYSLDRVASAYGALYERFIPARGRGPCAA
jgi:glycosyltransferase involved in cell wall biosynthesis